MTSNADPCLCGSGNCYADCCGPLHAGAAATTPEALMRSRYSAFYLGLTDYLTRTWHPTTRPAQLDLDERISWCGLQVKGAGASEDSGWVEFAAVFREDGVWRQLHERSRFVREQGRWFYVDGDAEWRTMQPGRNDPCPCGSGRKFKKCCAA